MCHEQLALTVIKLLRFFVLIWLKWCKLILYSDRFRQCLPMPTAALRPAGLYRIYHIRQYECKALFLCLDSASWHRGSVDQHMASAWWLWHRTWSNHWRRHQHIAVCLPMASRRSPGLPWSQRLRRCNAAERLCTNFVIETKRSDGSSENWHSIHV